MVCGEKMVQQQKRKRWYCGFLRLSGLFICVLTQLVVHKMCVLKSEKKRKTNLKKLIYKELIYDNCDCEVDCRKV